MQTLEINGLRGMDGGDARPGEESAAGGCAGPAVNVGGDAQQVEEEEEEAGRAGVHVNV